MHCAGGHERQLWVGMSGYVESTEASGLTSSICIGNDVCIGGNAFILLLALIYLLIVPPGPLMAGWAIPILTDTAFAVALIVMFGDRLPVELRVFLTAVVIIDDLAAYRSHRSLLLG